MSRLLGRCDVGNRMGHVTTTHHPSPRPTLIREFVLTGLQFLTPNRPAPFPGNACRGTILEGLDSCGPIAYSSSSPSMIDRVVGWANSGLRAPRMVNPGRAVRSGEVCSIWTRVIGCPPRDGVSQLPRTNLPSAG